MVLGGDTGRVPTDVTLDNWQSAAQSALDVSARR